MTEAYEMAEAGAEMTAAGATQGEQWRPVHHVVFPTAQDDPRVRQLYVELGDAAQILDRGRLRLEPGAHAGFATYFGALPAAVWRARTATPRLRLYLEAQGPVTVTVRTGIAGRVLDLARAQTDGGTVIVDVPLDERVGGWIWFDLDAGSADAVVSDIAWEAPEIRAGSTVAIGITTFDRVEDCLEVVRRLALDDRVAARIARVTVVDQGRTRIRAHVAFAAVSALWGDRLRVVEQPNLGGSGGFSRGMIEALGTAASHVLLLDDDVVLEPESLHRMLAFADHADGLPLVGAQMLSLTDPTLLHSYGERVDRRRFWWEPVAPELSPVDLRTVRIGRDAAAERAYDVDFNGWWMCLIPLPVVRSQGAALPVFIKWDDAEYGLRARAAGHPTVTLPGAALWHMPWTAKDDGLDWQAYFQFRNRLVTALIHADRARPWPMFASTFGQDVNHVLCLQYGSATLRGLALQDVLAGPARMAEQSVERAAQVRRLLAEGGQVVTATDLLPSALRDHPALRRPAGRVGTARRLVAVALHQLRRPRGGTNTVTAALSREQGKWWSLGLLDSATVDSATGEGAFVARRSRARSGRLLLASLGGHLRLWWGWRRLARRYRESASELASIESWTRVFESHS